MIGTSTPIRGFVVSLASGIIAVTLIPLGIVFAVLEGLLGLIFLGVGVLCALAALLTLRAGRAQRARGGRPRLPRQRPGR
jgi:hypothetical protein